MRGGKILRADGTVANGRKPVIDRKIQITCYFLEDFVNKIGRDECRILAENAVEDATINNYIISDKKKSVGVKKQVTCYFRSSSIEKFGRAKCRIVAENAIENELKKISDGIYC